MNRTFESKARDAVRKAGVGFFGLLLAAAGHAQATPQTVHVETCLIAASAVKTGDYLKVEYLSVSPRGVPTYAIEIRGTDGREWELMCDALTGTIYEIEQEASGGSDPLFRERARISEEEARDRALSLYP